AILSSLYLSYTNNIELKEMEAQNLVIAKEYYETSIDKYKLGSLSGLELREAQVSLQDAEERLLLAIYNIKLCEISLKQVSGKISEYMEEE
ncbi:MAG TPA: TolC family protein, partial [Paludibacteraceae bacterium]|nr:TolC family protein [Paludibacteraceae bacterium]